MQRMDKLRRSLRDSFRRKKDPGPESSKPHQWQADEEAVRAGNCTFHVKYLGCVEVYESRGMQVCEEAMKVLRGSRRRPVKANLYVTGDGLRVVEDETKGLIVDQTIEKVSFCAPDRNHERGFSYICRDGTTRRWMCHGFVASKDSGERLSHAVGCAFAVCLERKQKREKECGVTMTYDTKTSTFTRSGSFRIPTMTESKATLEHKPSNATGNVPPPRPPPISTAAIERPHATTKMLERQGSFRGFSQLAKHSPFKRQLSLRLNELPSNLQRTQQTAINFFGHSPALTNGETANNSMPPVSSSPTPPPRTQRSRLHSLPTAPFGVGTIPEASSSTNSSELNLSLEPSQMETNKDLVSELCQQVTHGLTLLAANHDDASSSSSIARPNYTCAPIIPNKLPNKFTTNPWDEEVGNTQSSSLPIFNTTALATANSVIPNSSNNAASSFPATKPVDSWMNNLTQNHEPKAPMQPKISPIKENVALKASSQISSSKSQTAIIPPNRNVLDASSGTTTAPNEPLSIESSGIRHPNKLVHSGSVAANNFINNKPPHRSIPPRSQSLGADPFDADWAAPLARTGQTPTNPFRQQTFQISM